MKKSELQQIIREEISNILELNPDTFKSAINISKQRGTDRRTYRLGGLYFNKFKGKPLFGGEIVEIGVSNPQHANYRQVTIIVKVMENGKPKDLFIHYDIDKDLFDVDEIDRTDARTLSLIAQHINPNTRYKTTNTFSIKGDY